MTGSADEYRRRQREHRRYHSIRSAGMLALAMAGFWLVITYDTAPAILSFLTTFGAICLLFGGVWHLFAGTALTPEGGWQ